MVKNIFVLGLDSLNKEALERLPGAKKYKFHQLLTREELVADPISIPRLIAKADLVLQAFKGKIDAIVGYWDFPGSMLVPLLCERYGLRSTSLRSVVVCEHKYWSRLKQSAHIEEVPQFGLLDLDSPVAQLPDAVDFPVWIKPVKSSSSQGAYYVPDAEALTRAREDMRAEVERVGSPFEDFLTLLDLPEEVSAAGGRAAIVEEAAVGHQFTVEGFVQDNEVVLYGVVDSIRVPGWSSFLRYQYPSVLPAPVRTRALEISERIVSVMGLNHTTFNIEYFWDEDADRMTLLEINVRHSQSHALLFEMVDGFANHAFMVDLALGNRPQPLQGAGPHTIAAKWFLRHFADGIVRRVPSKKEIAALEKRFPGTVISTKLRVGDRLSDSYGEDSYSYVLAEIFTGGNTEAELQRIFNACAAGLRFEIDEIPTGFTPEAETAAPTTLV